MFPAFPAASSLWIAKACAAGLLLVALYVWGRSNGVEAEQRRNSVEMAVCQSDRAVLATTLDEANARTRAAKAAEKQQAERADQAEQGAKADAATYEDRIDDIASQLAKAKRQASCRAELEKPLCADLQ